MAEAVISDVAAGLISKLGSLVRNELGFSRGLTDELDKLGTTVSTIGSVLLHAEEKSIENHEITHWLRLLSEAMYDADDLLDELSTEVLRRQVVGGSKIPQKVRLFFSSSNQFSFGLKMGRKVKAIRDRLDQIAVIRKFHLLERTFRIRDRDETHSYSSPAPEVIFGREPEKEQIVQRLLSSDYEEENVSGFAIVGIGGLGKTALAQMVYNDDRVTEHFELKMWVYVSDDFDVKLMVKKVLESAYRTSLESTEMMDLLENLHETINGRRYLLVLDDLWNEDWSKWFAFKDLLRGGARGSNIVVTTRLVNVAKVSCQPISIHQLGGLSRDDSWSLFKLMAFKQGQVATPSHEAVGREIVEKCYGVPLAIKAIGAMLRFKDSESEWLLFKNKELRKIDAYENGILPVLKLSYNHLPPHYKHCFASCSLYPKDYKFRVDELVHLWMAQGYLKLTDPNKHFQDVGFAYIMDLFQLSFFQEVEKDMYGDIVSFKMHDLMHDLAISVAGDNFSVQHSKMISLNDKTRHVSFVIDGNSILQDFPSLLAAKRVRTLLPFVETKVPFEEDLNSIFCNLRCLRMLNLSYLGINLLPSSICKLKHLRCLNLSYNKDIKKLPDSVTNLQNLQLLQLSFCAQLMLLPKNITKLVNLWHLDNNMCNALTHMPRGIGQLTRLERLSTFVIAKDNSFSKFCGGLDELHALNNLRGSLTIKNLRYVKSIASECKAADLNAKQHLKSLELIWNEDEDDNSDYGANDEMGLEALQPHQRSYEENDRSSRDEELLEGLQPHPNIERIKIRYYRGGKWPSWMLRTTISGDDDSFRVINNLVDLRLERCSNCVELPCLGDLPHLKFLKINHLGKVKCVDSKFYGIDREGSSIGCMRFFPSLISLSISHLKNLTEWCSPSDDNKVVLFPCLESLSIQSCPKLTGFPLSNLSELIKLEIRDCEELRILTSRQQSFGFLTSLSITGCSKFTYLRNWLLSNKCFELCVRRCEWLTFVPDDLAKVICLTSLEIYGCKRLKYFPEQILGKFTQLQNLSIGAFSEELDDFRYLNKIQDLPCLVELEIWGSDFLGRKMSSLPIQLGHLTALKSLKIMGFTTMEALPGWLINLQSLQYLSLDYCSHLLWSPSTTTVIENLCSLTHLKFNCCPLLEESKSEWLQSLDTTRIKVEFSHVSNVRVRLGY